MTTWTKEQSEAITKSGSNIIVSAGAGSGKTAVLSERVINKIENGIHVNELLILTFTKAASSEMKDRIRKKISKNPNLKSELNLLNSSYITTFDSFALSVLKKYHYLLNISPNISISDESLVTIEENRIIDEIFENRYKNHDKDFEELIQKYCVKSDNVLRKNILKISKNINNLISKEEYINNIKSNFFSEENIKIILSDYEDLIKDKINLVKLELENISYYFDSDYYDKVMNSISNILNINSNSIHEYSKVSLPSVPRNSSEEGKEAKNNLKKAIDELLELSKYGTIDNIKSDILNSKKIVLTIISIVEEYILKLSEYKKDNNIYTFNDVAYYSIKLLEENKIARDELKYSFKEIMIDEYQDTNDVQEKFISLIENNNVYMVGDIKQSIYRFRGSNPNIFKDKYENYSKNNGGIKIDLIKNFRSRDEVLDNINRIFELIMDNYIGGANYKESHEMIYGNTNYDLEKINEYNYQAEVLEYSNDKTSEFTNSEIEIFTIANDIKNKINSNFEVFDKNTNKLRKATYNDFVIILDRSRYFDDFKKVFEYLGIPLTILMDDKLNSNIDISIIKNIIDIIIRINNNDLGVEFKYDFMSIGRSFLYELSDEYLFNVFYENSFKDSIIYNDFKKIASLNSKTSGELFNEILDITDYYNKLNKIGDYENTNVRLRTISELATNLNNLGLSIECFKDYLNEILDSGIDIKYNAYFSDSDSVKIMTIHKSKGLEYPVCYFTDLDHKFNTSDIKDLFIVDNTYGLIIPSDMDDTNTSLIKELYKYNYKKEEISEKVRLFYVALTRAREKMIIVLPYSEKLKLEKDNNGLIDQIRRVRFNKLSDIIFSIKEYLPSYFNSIDVSKIGLSKNYLYKKNVDDKIVNNNTEFDVKEINIHNEEISESHYSKETTNLISFESMKNMKYGTTIHEIFELIDFKHYDESLIEDEFIRNKISSFINNDLLKNIADSNIYHEYEFEYEFDNTIYHGIIDLMIEYNDKIDIFDFKLKNTQDEHYYQQLNGYKKYINSISNKPVNLYLYSILDEEINKIEQ